MDTSLWHVIVDLQNSRQFTFNMHKDEVDVLLDAQKQRAIWDFSTLHIDTKFIYMITVYQIAPGTVAPETTH